MKHLTLLLILTTSLSAFSQSADTSQLFDTSTGGRAVSPTDGISIGYVTTGRVSSYVKPDTLRAIILVAMCPNGIAHARTGYVVIEPGKRPVYLDCRKRALKWPVVGWDWREVGVNEKVR